MLEVWATHIFKESETGYLVCTPQGKILHTNPAAACLLNVATEYTTLTQAGINLTGNNQCYLNINGHCLHISITKQPNTLLVTIKKPFEHCHQNDTPVMYINKHTQKFTCANLKAFNTFGNKDTLIKIWNRLKDDFFGQTLSLSHLPDQLVSTTLPNADGKQVFYKINIEEITTKDGLPHFKITLTGAVDKPIPENLHRELIESANESVVVIQDTKIVFANPQLTRLTGFDTQDLIGSPFATLLPPNDMYLVENHLNSLFAHKPVKNVFELPMITRAGQSCYGLVTSTHINYNGRPAALFLITDVTQKYKDSQALQHSEYRYRQLVETLPYSIIELNPDGRIDYVNQATCYLLGFSREELDLVSIFDLLEKLPDQKAKAIALFAQATEGTLTDKSFEITAITKDEKKLDLLVNWSAVYDPEENLSYLISIITDITERKKHAEEQKNSLRTKETLLREIHHRVKNNLQIIFSLLDMHARNSDEQTQKVFRESQNRIMAMALTHEILYASQDISKINTEEYINKLASNILKSYGHHPASSFLQIETQPNISADITLAITLGLIINELLTNALKHAFSQTQKPKILLSLTSNKMWLKLTVADNGNGIIPQKIKAQNINRPLGLNLVSRLCRQNNGYLEVSSGPKGSAFSATIPTQLTKSHGNKNN